MNLSDLDMRYIATCDCAYAPDSDLEKAKKEFEELAKTTKFMLSNIGEVGKKFLST